jgi:hypothetical protein
MKRIVGAALLLTPVLAAQEMCVISGTVVDAVGDRPVGHVRVFAGSADAVAQDAGGPAVLRFTNAAGHFCFERLSEGSYKITAQKAGYLDATFGQQHANSPGLPVKVDSERASRPSLFLKIMPQAVISGVVTDANGDPVSHAQIRLWRRSILKEGGPSQVVAKQADEQGRFRLWQIAPGAYYLSVLPPSLSPEKMIRDKIDSLDSFGHPFRELPVETFYKGALTIGNATPIALKAGQEITGLAIAMQNAPLRHIAGRIEWDVSHGGLPQRWLLRSNEGLTGIIEVEKDGHFHIEGLVPGAYSLIASSPTGVSEPAKK